MRKNWILGKFAQGFLILGDQFLTPKKLRTFSVSRRLSHADENIRIKTAAFLFTLNTVYIHYIFETCLSERACHHVD